MGNRKQRTTKGIREKPSWPASSSLVREWVFSQLTLPFHFACSQFSLSSTLCFFSLQGVGAYLSNFIFPQFFCISKFLPYTITFLDTVHRITDPLPYSATLSLLIYGGEGIIWMVWAKVISFYPLSIPSHESVKLSSSHDKEETLKCCYQTKFRSAHQRTVKPVY